MPDPTSIPTADAIQRLTLAASIGSNRVVLNAVEACAWLGLDRIDDRAAYMALYELRPALRPVKVGKHVRWRVSDLTAYVEGLTTAEAVESTRKPRIAS
mgnify:FL=1